MTAQLLATELTNLIQESKRKHNDLRQAAERSLEELKSLNISSEAQLGPELTQKTNFANPFIIACGTKNAKFTGIAIVCLQRLIVSKALPRPRLNQVLEALQGATSAGLDVQLKILQALPSLLQNYSSDIRGELLVTALNICFILQSSKNAIVNNTSAATLQQLVVTVFDKVVTEDMGEAPTEGGVVSLKPAAMDAYRVFNDLCLLTESQRPEYLRFTGLPQTFGLELIESVLTNHASTITSHPEQAHILQTRVMPFIVQSLGAKLNFPTTVRFLRILYTILRRHLTLLPSECGEALEILTRLLDQETLTWKRSLCMEVFRGIFSDAGLLRKVYSLFDAREGQQKVLKNLVATFVRVSTEKPNIIGLGQQSTIPVANPYSSIGATTDQAMLDAAGVGGIISGPVGSEGYNTGISTQWSSVRVPCIDQLDKTEPPSIPESYIYSLTLACITSLSEGLAKFILPLTIADRGKRRGPKADIGAGSGRNSPAPPAEDMGTLGKGTLERTSSYKRNPVPVNPLLLEEHPLHTDIKICANIVDECWPAILATCSTFLTSALDSEYYHGLVRAFQKFAHVAGLLQLTTPRDAFLTTLGKAAVPPNVLTACLNGTGARPQTPTGADPANSLLGNARGILSADNLQASDRPRQGSVVDVGPATLNTRNMLCLRALLNLGIALGPTLEESWRILLETLQQADFVLFASSKVAGRVPTATRTPDQQADSEAQALLGNFNSEVKAVETAASRLFESTVDFSNTSFVEVVEAVCNLLDKPNEPASPAVTRPESPASSSGNDTLRTPGQRHRRTMSSMSMSAAPSAAATQQDQFALAKLGDLASINLERLLTYPPAESGWTPLVSELIGTLSSATVNAPVRSRAADILVRFVLECVSAVAGTPDEVRGAIQLRLFEALRDSMLPLQMPNRDISVATHSTDVEIHKIILEGLKSILESCGESLLSGWDLTFEIIDSIFLRRRFSPAQGEDESNTPPEALMTRSIKLIKPSFDSLQLICSDFLASLPNSCFLLLVDTLFKFCSQDDDLNVALTINDLSYETTRLGSAHRDSKTLTSSDWDETAVVVINGVSDLLSNYLEVLVGHTGFKSIWSDLLQHFANMLDFNVLEINSAAFNSLGRILSKVAGGTSKKFDKEAVDLAWDLWSRSLPVPPPEQMAGDNQKCLVSWVEALLELYRLIHETLDVERVRRLLTLVREAMIQATPGSYASDIEYLTPLQGKILEVLRTVRTDISGGAPSAMISQAAEFVAFAFDPSRTINTPTQKRTYVAMSKESMRILHFHVTSNASDSDMFASGAFHAALEALARPIVIKYSFGVVTKSIQPWREATEATLAILDTTLPHLKAASAEDVPRDKAQAIWHVIVEIANGIISANCDSAPSSADLEADEVFDVDSFQRLRELIVPALGGQDVAEKTRKAFAEGLFRTSIMHELTPAESQVMQPSGCDVQRGLGMVLKARDGRTIDPVRTRRAKMAGVCLEELFALVEAKDYEVDMPSIVVQPPTPRFPKSTQRTMDSKGSDRLGEGMQTANRNKDIAGQHVQLARTTAPYLILRCALTLRAYIADQPLRGRMPQPLGERAELTRVLKGLVELQSESDAIPDLEGVDSETRKHLLRLYPLLVGAARVAGRIGDGKVLGLVGEALGVVGGEFGL
ncbi:hypothetical protein OOU_Y34scaffold00692g33 [Pyricularia oryzae Y34]|uniref:Endosomal peripheral membrane protein n=2 Tax=Pyricularia oryzae TaxID=318829 RepID=A0AA97NSY3_PYRO3|nr:hypothetical protein OOU_Y34scaffold00692g33 [Pyricularia oryzae Y34]